MRAMSAAWVFGCPVIQWDGFGVDANKATQPAQRPSPASGSPDLIGAGSVWAINLVEMLQ